MAVPAQSYTGIGDFYPEDKRLQKHIYATVRRVVEQFGYEECAALSLEQLVLTRQQRHAHPLRWYSITGAGVRQHGGNEAVAEHGQLQAAIFGVQNLLAEVEIIQCINSLFKVLGATHDMYAVHLNSRRFIDFVLYDYLGLDGVQGHTMLRLLERMHSMPHDDFLAEIDAVFTPSQREAGASNKLVGILKTKTLAHMPEAIRQSSAALELKELLHLLHELRIPNARFDITVMHKFNRHTGIVFEVHDTHPESSRQPLLGGGRSDGVTAATGITPLQSVGFSYSEEKLYDFLRHHDLLSPPRTETDVYVALSGPVYTKAQRVIDDMRDMGANVAVDITGAPPETQIQAAIRKGIHYIMFIGEKELDDEQYTIRNLVTGVVERHSAARIVSIIKDYRSDDSD